MTDIPQFISVTPTVLDERRVTVNIKTANLPEVNRLGACLVNLDQPPTPNVSLNLDTSTPPTPPMPPVVENSADSTAVAAPQPADSEQIDATQFEQSKFPIVEVNLVDSEENFVAHSMIIEHQEPDLSITMHIRSPKPGETYTAYAELIYHEELVHVVSAPFVWAADEMNAQ